jgi:hypothetical protein
VPSLAVCGAGNDVTACSGSGGRAIQAATSAFLGFRYDRFPTGLDGADRSAVARRLPGLPEGTTTGIFSQGTIV